MNKPLNLPSLADLQQCLKYLKRYIDDDMIEDGETTPSMSVTIGWTNGYGWNYQTGDNSYTGGAYGFDHWAIVTLYRRSNSAALARDAINQLLDLHYGC